MGMVLSSSPSSLMSRKEPEGLLVDSVAAFLVAFFGFVAESLLATGADAEFTSGEVFSLSAFLGADFGAVVFGVGSLSPGLMAG